MTDDKFILDATAGFRMMWFNKHHPNTVYLDQRPECEPDIVGDFRDLKQFPNETFRLIVFDPPHIIRSTETFSMKQVRAYGQLKPETWQADLKKGFLELWRILKPFGILIFKWTNYQVMSNAVLDLFPEKPLFYQISSSKPYQTKSGKLDGREHERVKTVWFCFMKIPEDGVRLCHAEEKAS